MRGIINWLYFEVYFKMEKGIHHKLRLVENHLTAR